MYADALHTKLADIRRGCYMLYSLMDDGLWSDLSHRVKTLLHQDVSCLNVNCPFNQQVMEVTSMSAICADVFAITVIIFKSILMRCTMVFRNIPVIYVGKDFHTSGLWFIIGKLHTASSSMIAT